MKFEKIFNVYEFGRRGFRLADDAELHTDPSAAGKNPMIPEDGNWMDGEIDSFFDFVDCSICKGEDGNLYAVDFHWHDGDWKPLIWERVVGGNGNLFDYHKCETPNGEWDMEMAQKLCEDAGMLDEWLKADGETFESVIFAAAKKLEVWI